jgi:dynein heavy chain 1
MKRTVDNIKDPLYRFFEREVNLGARLLADVRSDLEQVLAVCSGKQKQSNYLRTLTTALNKGIVPDHWRRYTVPDVTVILWIQDMAERILQLQRIADVVIKDQAKGLKVGFGYILYWSYLSKTCCRF